MSSVSFESSKRSGRVPLSYYSPLTVTSDKKFWNLLPKNAVPTGKGKAAQQVGYWNEQPRWRMQKGQRVEKPSFWHFYYLGTGPHADAKFRERIQGVVWVSKANANLEPTQLGTRTKARNTSVPKFDIELPADIEIVDKSSTSNSRANSRSQSRGPSGGSKNRQDSSYQPRDNSNNRGASQSRNNSRGRGQQRNNNQQQRSAGNSNNNTADLAAAIVLALEKAGLTRESQASPKKEGSNNNKKSKSRASSPAPAQSKTSDQLSKVVWKRTPDPSCDVEKCFGPRNQQRNFGDADAVVNGARAKHFPTWASLTPNAAALLFNSEIITTEDGDHVVITYQHHVRVPKSDPALAPFLSQVSAYAQPHDSDTVVIESEEDAPSTSTRARQLNPKAETFVPPRVDPNYFTGMKVEIMDKTVTDDSTA